ncbi:MAG: tol-pal system protein YbgF [Lautropia sp.]
MSMPNPSRPRRPACVSLTGAAVFTLLLSLQFGAPRPAWALFGDDEARRAVLEVRGKLEVFQRDTLRQLNEFGRQQADMEQRLSRLEQGQRVNLDQQNQLEALRQEVARLRGQLEVQLNEMSQTRRQQKELSATLDTRLKQFEPIQVTIDDKAASVEQTAKRDYDAALELFRGSDFKGAIAAFQSFQKTYPDSAYRPLVMYWQGGAQYASGDFKGAIGTMDQLAAKYPDNARVPDALLILGNAQADSGDRKSARETFKAIGEKYPGTPASGAAKDRLTSLR